MGFNLSSIITGKRYIIEVTDILIHFNGFITGCWKSDEEQFGGCNTISTLCWLYSYNFPDLLKIIIFVFFKLISKPREA